ncbi:MAG: ROK family protein [bacterium]|nr:ROK family protein [bacterium]
MDIRKDTRIVLTMDAGGTNIVFSAMGMGKALVDPVCLPACGEDLDLCLQSIVDGFERIKRQLPGPPSAISFSFPGPADYLAGIIGDLSNLPAFKGGVPLGPMLEDRFGIPVFINNDGDLFAYGEAIAGFLPETERALEAAGTNRRFRNLLGVTIGTGFGAGLISGERLYLGDNGSGMEIWSTRSGLCQGCIAEEGVSARALRRVYAQEAGIPESQSPDPKQMSAVLDGLLKGNQVAAARAYSALGDALGDSLADAVCLTDSLVVIGGGISGAYRHFLDVAVERMNSRLRTRAGADISRMQVKAYNLEDSEQREAFVSESPQELPIPGTDRTIPYFANKSIGVGISVLGSSEAVTLGAYAYALHALDAAPQTDVVRGQKPFVNATIENVSTRTSKTLVG